MTQRIKAIACPHPKGIRIVFFGVRLTPTAAERISDALNKAGISARHEMGPGQVPRIDIAGNYLAEPAAGISRLREALRSEFHRVVALEWLRSALRETQNAAALLTDPTTAQTKARLLRRKLDILEGR